MISCGQQSDHTAPSSFSLVLSLVLRHLAKNRKKNSLLALPNPTPKSRNQAMHVTPPRSPSQELSIVLQDCRWCGVSEEIEEGWPSWPPQQFPLACSSERLAPEQQASHAGSKSARQQQAPEQRAAMEQQACGNRECQCSRTGERGRDDAQDPQRRWKRVESSQRYFAGFFSS